jgi:hypothetical protein
MNLKEKNVIIRNKMPLNYQNSVIYKICCKDPTIKDIYVGSTTSFKRRMSEHKSICNNEKSEKYNYPVYRFIRDTGGFNNWSIVKIRDVCCKDKYELVAEERKEFELLGATLNKNYPQRSDEQYRKDNKEKILEKAKEYYEENKVEILEKTKEYRSRPEVKEKISEKKKEHYQENKVEILEYHKKLYEKNREKILEKRKEKVECPCGSVVCRGSLTAHKKTQKHQNWEKTLQDN